jgi:hypothetical protein
VRDITISFGNNAGKLWKVLNERGCLSKEDIIRMTNLGEEEFNSALGWLAREDKITKEENNFFRLDNTNLHNEIGTNAGRIWKILDIWGDVDYTSIRLLSDLNDNDIHKALGWLARENKIFIDEKNRFNLK